MTSIDEQHSTEQAAVWITRIQSGEIDPDNSEDLRRWLNEDSAHQRSFQKMLTILSRTEILAEVSVDTLPGTEATVGPRRQYWLATAAAVIVTLGAGAWFSMPSGERIQTHTGERALMTLDDGSSVHLNADSSVEIRFSSTERLAFMQSGEIVFDVDKTDPRPFLVRSENLDIEVTGTTFQVSNYGADTAVSVLEGSVLVRPNSGTTSLQSTNNGESVEIGEQVKYGNGRVSSPLAIDVGRATAWREGWLYLDTRPLHELVGRLNRQFDGRIEVADEQVANSDVTVALKMGRRADTLSQLELMLPIRFEAMSGDRHIVHAAP